MQKIDLEWLFVDVLEEEREPLQRALKPQVSAWFKENYSFILKERTANPSTQSTSMGDIVKMSVAGRKEPLWLALRIVIDNDPTGCCLVGVAQTEERAELLHDNFLKGLAWVCRQQTG